MTVLISALMLMLAAQTVPPSIRVGGQVQEAKLVHYVAPEYPIAARSAHIAGRVLLDVRIDRFGTVSDVKVNSGHELLAAAAVDAVRQWRYEPTLLNGQPVDVTTAVEAVFQLDDLGRPVLPVPGRIHASKLINRVDPVYPPLAKQARIQSTVRLEAQIATDGAVKMMRVISGHPLLVQAALDAVRQWRYEPAMLNGERVEVATTIDVTFAFPPD